MNLWTIKTLDPQQGDQIAFIKDSWLLSYWNSGRAPSMSRGLYAREHAKRIDGLLKKTKPLLCVSSEDLNQFLGYAFFDDHCLHYMYTKFVFRQQGIAKELLTKIGGRNYHSHMTPVGMNLKLKSEYNPYLFVS